MEIFTPPQIKIKSENAYSIIIFHSTIFADCTYSIYVFLLSSFRPFLCSWRCLHVSFLSKQVAVFFCDCHWLVWDETVGHNNLAFTWLNTRYIKIDPLKKSDRLIRSNFICTSTCRRLQQWYQFSGVHSCTAAAFYSGDFKSLVSMIKSMSMVQHHHEHD